MVKVEIISTDTIKPSSPTPLPLRNFKLSLLDQLAPTEYVPLVFFYSAKEGDKTEAEIVERIDLLKKSLSETLTRYYPVAGRIKDDNKWIECNDEGVDFFEAKVDCPLSQVVKQPQAELLNRFLPQDADCRPSPAKAQFATQVNVFTCGGMAIGICTSHKIFDGSTTSQFINDWAAMSRGQGENVSPVFPGASLFPPRDLPGMPQGLNLSQCKCISKRFVFDASSIALLRAKVAMHAPVVRPTRFEVTLALIWRCAMKVQRVKSKSFRPSVGSLTMNLRTKTVPHMPQQSAGNLYWSVGTAVTTESEIELHDLVCKLREEKTKFDGDVVMKMQGEKGKLPVFESLKKLGKMLQTADFYAVTSFHHFPLYEADFGWGKPVWVSVVFRNNKNCITLMDTPQRDGIEAWLTLEEQEMPIFERDPELLTFVSSQS